MALVLARQVMATVGEQESAGFRYMSPFVSVPRNTSFERILAFMKSFMQTNAIIAPVLVIHFYPLLSFTQKQEHDSLSAANLCN